MSLKLTVNVNRAELKDRAAALNITPAALLKIIEAIVGQPEPRVYVSRAGTFDPVLQSDIRMAILSDDVGFRGGWISSLYSDRLIADRVRRPLRRALMLSLGYVPHPALPAGRVNNIVQPDDARPVLYLRNGHPALSLTAPAEIARAYSDAQLRA